MTDWFEIELAVESTMLPPRIGPRIGTGRFARQFHHNQMVIASVSPDRQHGTKQHFMTFQPKTARSRCHKRRP